MIIISCASIITSGTMIMIMIMITSTSTSTSTTSNMSIISIAVVSIIRNWLLSSPLGGGATAMSKTRYQVYELYICGI